LTDPSFYGQFWARLSGDEGGGPYSLAQGHFTWFKAMEEKGCLPMEMLRAATRNIAEAYGKDQDLGTLEPGKIADVIVLDKNPLQAADNYRSIHTVIQDGVVVDRDALPTNPILTRPMESPVEEEASYVPFFSTGTFPLCPLCMHR
jgi:adenine deaminase